MAVEPLAAVIVLLAVLLAYVNGFHDASNAVSTTITTRALRERTALGMAALLNLFGALLGIGLVTVSSTWAFERMGLGHLTVGVDTPGHVVLWILLTGVLTTIAWDLITWWMGMPSSSWHALFAGVGGASLVLGWDADWSTIARSSLLPTAFAPLLGAAAAYATMQLISRLLTSDRLRSGHLRFAQTVSAGLVATAHGLQDALIPMAVIVAVATTSPMPGGVLASAPYTVAVAIALGTFMGGHRIIRTLGSRLTDLTTPQGFSAEAATATLMGLVSLGMGLPVSSSHSIAAGIMGAGLARGPRALRLPVVRRILAVWLATPFACFGMGLVIARIAQTSTGL